MPFLIVWEQPDECESHQHCAIPVYNCKINQIFKTFSTLHHYNNKKTN